MAPIVLAIFVVVFAASARDQAVAQIEPAAPRRPQGRVAVGLGPQQVEVLRDTWGVPHIYGDTAEAAMYGFGWAQAEDHMALMSVFYLECNARLTETFRDDIPYTVRVETAHDLVRSDNTMRLFRMSADPHQLWSEIDRHDPAGWSFSTSGLLTAFAAGVNAWVEAHPELVPAWVPHFTGPGVLATARYLTVARQIQLAQNKQGAAGDLFLLPYDAGEWSGSNQFVVGPGRTDNGSVRLLAAPHLGFQGHTIWYEAHIVGGPFDVAGATFYGLPALPMAHNRRIAFSETSNGADNVDLFVLLLDPANPGHYLVDGVSVPFRMTEQTVRRPDGDSHTFRQAYSELGGFQCPVVDPLSTHDFAGRVSATVACATLIGDPWAVTQMWQMDLADSVGELRQAMAGLHLNMWNLVSGDVDGDIFYVCNSRHPRRFPGANWHAPLDGSSSLFHWSGLLTFDELPQASNPDAGFFQNCNDSPALVTPTVSDPIDMAGFPPDLCWHDTEIGLRGRRMINLLDGGGRHSLEDMAAFALDSHSLLAEAYAPRLVRWAADLAELTSDPAAVARGAQILDRPWDFRASTDSVQMALFTAWLYEARQVEALPYPAPPDADVDLGLKVGALELLGGAVQALEAAFGSAAVRYGTVHRIRRGSVDAPVGGGESFVQTLHLNSSDEIGGTAGYAWSGSSYLMLTELSADRVRALSLKPWGQSDDPGSSHYDDLTVEYANERFKDFWYDRSDVEAHLESRTVLTYDP